MEKRILLAIILLAFLLRFVKFTTFPAGFNADETSFGYDAYSILKTGRDQWGMAFPLVLKSFGDYKSPLYSYLAVPFVAIFGLNEFSVRVVSVVVGTLAVYVAYLLGNSIVNAKFTKWKLPFGLLPAFLLAVSPWHVMLSRAAIESNLVTLFLPLGIYLFILGLENTKYLTYSALSFGLNLFTYHSGKFLTPLVVFALLIIFWKKIKLLEFKKIIPSAIIFGIFFAALLYTFTTGGGSRIAERSIFQGALEQGAEEKIKLINSGADPTYARILHNKYQVVATRFINNYKQYFSLRFFTHGAGESYYGMIPGIGVVYYAELLLFCGSIFLIRKNNYKNIIAILFAWLLLAPMPAALSTGVGYSGARAEGMIPVMQIIESLGLIGLIGFISKFGKKAVIFSLVLLTALLIFEVNSFLKSYMKNPPNSVSRSMLIGNLEVASWLAENSVDKRVVVSRSLSEPHIFTAFVSKWDPRDFKREAFGWNFDASNVSWIDQLPEWSLGRYTFKSLDWNGDSRRSNTLIVGKPEEFPLTVYPLYTVYYPDGTPNIYVIDAEKSAYAKVY